MSLSFPGLSEAIQGKKSIPYELCISVQNKSLSAAVMQTEDAGLLPQNTEMMVAGKQTYDIYPEG